MSERGYEVVNALYERRIDVCCVQEVRWKGEGVRVFSANEASYKLFWKGCKSAEAGVGILVKREWADKVVKVARYSERCMSVKMVIGGRMFVVLSAYAPQIGRSEDEKERFYEELNTVMKSFSDREEVILAGDFNGHLGKASDGYESVHGGKGHGIRNREGERVLDFATQWNMCICNTWFFKEEKCKFTYESGQWKSMIDLVLVSKKQRKFVQDIKTIKGEECVKQHKLVVCIMIVAEEKKKEIYYEPKIKVWKLRNKEIRNKFQEEVKTKMKIMGGVNESWNEMKKVLVDTAARVCQVRRGRPRHKETWWWNEEVKEAIKNKKACYKLWKKSGKEADRKEYTLAKHTAKKIVAIAKQKKSKELAETLKSDEGRRKVFRIAKHMIKEQQDVMKVSCMKDENGALVLNEIERRNIWKSYMEKLLNEENMWNHEVVCEVKEGPPCQITEDEIRKALQRMKSGKAGGFSNVVTEMLKATGKCGETWLMNLCNQIIAEKRIPEDWKHSLILPIYKGKGDPLDCGSYRPIKLLEHSMKVLERVLERRIRDQVKIDDMQFGFTPGKSTTDAIFIVRQMQEKYRAKRRPLYYAFVDLEKAYDRIPREVVQWALRKAGVEEWLVDTVMCMYKGARTAVKTEEGLSEWFNVLVGLHQGSALSPLLFTIVMDVIGNEIKSGLPWEVLYADDLVLMAESEEELKEKLLNWKQALESKGMKVNTKKTKVMVGKVLWSMKTLGNSHVEYVGRV